MIHYSFGELIGDILKPIIAAAIMGLILIGIGKLLDGHVSGIIVPLLVKTLAGVVIYWLLAVLFKMEGLKEMLSLLKRRKNKKVDTSNE